LIPENAHIYIEKCNAPAQKTPLIKTTPTKTTPTKNDTDENDSDANGTHEGKKERERESKVWRKNKGRKKKSIVYIGKLCTLKLNSEKTTITKTTPC